MTENIPAALLRDARRNAPVRLSVALDEAEMQENTIRGVAAVMGNMDRNSGVIVPGYFKPVLKSFLASGFVALSHDWDDLPVAMPLKAEEQGNQFYTEALFHSTEAAQNARVVCQERISKNLAVGLSIGWIPDYAVGEDGEYAGVKYFENGAKMLKYISANYDDSLFDAKSIRAQKSWCRLFTKCADLVEYSIVTRPGNARANATEVNSARYLSLANDFDPESVTTAREFEAFLRDAGFSRKQSADITLHGYTASLQRDAEAEEAEEPTTEAPPAKPVAVDLHALRLREMHLHEFAVVHSCRIPA